MITMLFLFVYLFQKINDDIEIPFSRIASPPETVVGGLESKLLLSSVWTFGGDWISAVGGDEGILAIDCNGGRQLCGCTMLI